MQEKLFNLMLKNYYKKTIINEKELLRKGFTKKIIFELVENKVLIKNNNYYIINFEKFLLYVKNNKFITILEYINIFTYLIELDKYNEAYLLLKILKDKDLNEKDYNFYLIFLSNFIDIDENIDDIKLNDILSNNDQSEARIAIFKKDYNLYKKLLIKNNESLLIKSMLKKIWYRKYKVFELIKGRKYEKVLIVLSELKNKTLDEIKLKEFIEQYLELKKGNDSLILGKYSICYYKEELLIYFNKILGNYLNKCFNKQLEYLNDSIYIVLNDIVNLLKTKNKKQTNLDRSITFSTKNFDYISKQPINTDKFFNELNKYLEEINKKEFHSIIIILLKISLLKRDFTYKELSKFLKEIATDKINLTDFLYNFYEAYLANNNQIVQYYFEIIISLMEIKSYNKSIKFDEVVDLINIENVSSYKKMYKFILENPLIFNKNNDESKRLKLN